MSGRGKLSRSLSTGVIVLVFFLLILQLGIFGVRIWKSYQVRRAEATAASGDTLVSNIANGTTASDRGGSARSGKSSPPDGGSPPFSGAKVFRFSSTSPTTKPGSASSNTNSTRQKPEDTSSNKRKFALAPLPPKPAYKPKPKVDINRADTTELMTLYGIGSYFARRIVEFRERLGGSYASVEQLMDIKGIDSARFVGFESRICIDSASVRRIDFYTYPLDSLALHPYIGKYAAKGVDRLRRTVPREEFTISALVENGIVSAPQAQRLLLYIK